MHPHVLVVDCSDHDDLLTRRQFVWPIQRNTHYASSSIHLSQFNQSSLKGFDAVIFSGCTLKDNEFVKRAKKLTWLKKTTIPMLGICAGHELLGLIFGGKLKKLSQPVIGIEFVTLHEKELGWLGNEKDRTDRIPAYHLNGNEVTLPAGFVCVGHSSQIRNEIMMNIDKRIMGFQFHPEYQFGGLVHSFLEWGLKP